MKDGTTPATQQGGLLARLTSGVLVAVFLIATTAGVGVPRADAFVIWCWDDPVIQVEGQTAQIRLGIEGDPALVRGIVASIRVHVPGGKGRVLVTSNRYFTEQVEWVENSPTPGLVEVTFSKAGGVPNLPAKMSIVSRSAPQMSYGWTNGALSGSIALR